MALKLAKLAGLALTVASWLWAPDGQLWYRSVWFLLWVAAIVSPGLIFFVRKYEERELEVRFGSAYRDYRLRTPFLWPRNPSPVTRQTRNPQA